MKLTTLFLLISSPLFAVSSAFGVSPKPQHAIATTSTSSAFKSKNPALSSPLFRRDPLITRGGAVPGWAAYNDSLDSHPLITKAMTSLVGWALGDFLAQVCCVC